MASGKLESVIMHILSVLKTDVSHYCDLETIDGNTIIASDGSCASIVRFDGTKSVLSREQFERMIEKLERTLSIFMKTRGHQLQMVFRRDLDSSDILKANAQQQLATAERLQMSAGVSELVEESVEKYSQYIYDEACYLVLWSRPALLDASERRTSVEQNTQFRKENAWPSLKDGQNILRPISFMYDRHQAYASKIVDDLSSKEFGCSVEMMDITSSLRAVRKSVQPDYTSDAWYPSAPGLGLSPRWKSNDDANDASELLYPPLPEQIMVTRAEIGSAKNKNLPDPTTVQIGSRVYAPMLVDKHAQDPQTFNVLFNALNRVAAEEDGQIKALPYSISFMLEADGMSVFGFNAMLSSVLSVASEVNKNINLAKKDLSERKRDGECIVKLRIGVMTWAGIGENGAKELARRKSKLWKQIEAWGKIGLVERTGNPMLAFQSNSVGLSWNHIGNPAPAPLGEALTMMPFTRPASAFSRGSNIFRSLDGKMMRYQRFSSDQLSWLTLSCGGPGMGKSLLLNNNTYESCIMPGLTRLPYLCTVDIGISSEGSVNLVRDNLPPELRHLVMYKRLQNSASDSINMMDTPLGLRSPLGRQRSTLVNFYTALATPPERHGKPYIGMSSFVGRVIDLVYRNKSDKTEKGQPLNYRFGQDPVLDQMVGDLSRDGFVVNEATKYWDVVDALFRAGNLRGAELAQRYAVPLMQDLIAAASDTEMMKEYGGTKVESGASLNDAFCIGIREAQGDYPIFREHTRFDIGPSRVMAIDLQDVAREGSDADNKQTALMFFIARESFMKKIAYHKDDLPQIEPMYVGHYKKLIAELSEDFKVLAFDEFHKTKRHQLLRDQLMTDARESRKWQLEISLASQLMEDFGELTRLATSMFILDAGKPQDREWMRENIGLSGVEEGALVNYVTGPKEYGSTFLARFVTKEGTFTQLYTLSVGPRRLWGLSTTAEDRTLRTILYQAVPGNVARGLLAKRFPSGSCKKTVEAMREEMDNTTEFIDEDMSKSIIERIAQSMLADHFGTNTLRMAA